MKTKQPTLFLSHGTIYEAFKSEKLKKDFAQIKREVIKNKPSAIVIFSGHWQTEQVTVTTNNEMRQMDEGFPPEFISPYKTSGDINLSNKIIELLMDNGIPAKPDANRVIDHGALIPLMLLFPEADIPVILISQQADLDPTFHKKMAEVLKPLSEDNVLIIGTGGLTHNRDLIHKFGGHQIEPNNWAKEFDDFITKELATETEEKYVDKMIAAYSHKQFDISHPTSEHFLPLVFASGFGGKPHKIYEAFQWKNLSMSAFVFE